MRENTWTRPWRTRDSRNLAHVFSCISLLSWLKDNKDSTEVINNEEMTWIRCWSWYTRDIRFLPRWPCCYRDYSRVKIQRERESFLDCRLRVVNVACILPLDRRRRHSWSCEDPMLLCSIDFAPDWWWCPIDVWLLVLWLWMWIRQGTL